MTVRGFAVRKPPRAPLTSILVVVPAPAGTVIGPRFPPVGGGGAVTGIVIVFAAPEFVPHGPCAT